MRARQGRLGAAGLGVLGMALVVTPTPVRGLQDPAPPPNGARFPEGVEEVDRIVAIVGDTAILMSELRITMFQLQSQGARVPPEGTAEWTRFARQVIAAEIDRLIVLQQAKRSGLTPAAQQVDELSESLYQRARQQFASDEALQAAVESSGMNMLQYRQLLRAQAEAEALLRDYRAQLERRTDLPPVVVTESEVEALFEEQASDQRRPALVTFNQLVVTPFPQGASRDSAIERARAALRELNEGEAFEIVARRYSDDEGTREQGGELGWMSRDLLVRPFGDAVWGARRGQTIGPIQTRFGLHVVRIENVRGNERFLRHVLVRPEISQADIDAASTLAAQLADSLRAGIDPERLARGFRGQVADERIRFDEIPVEQLTSRFPEGSAELRTPTPGEVYGPFRIEQGGAPEFAVVHVLEYRPEGPVELDDVRDQIRRSIRQSKQLDILLQEIRANTYIDVKL